MSESHAACAAPADHAATEQSAVLAVEPPLVTPSLAAAAVAGGALLIDVRSDKGRETAGTIPGAVVVDRTRVAELFDPAGEQRLPQVSGYEQSIVVVCGSINGSAPVARDLLGLGYRNVVHVDGGFPGWQNAGLPTQAPAVAQA